MRIAMVATRLGDVDGVSFEALKWRAALRRLGHEVVLCAGGLDVVGPGDRLVPEMHFNHPDVERVQAAAFDPTSDPAAVRAEVERLAEPLTEQLRDWLRDAAVDLLIVQNAWAIPMHLPLGLSLTRLARETGLPSIGHHHDYWWERARFAACVVPEIEEEAFPPDLPSVRHVSINSLAAGELERRRGLASLVVPNVFDFETPIAVDANERARLLRQELGLQPGAVLFVQPTRVVPRKGIELAIELIARLGRPSSVLLITSPAGDEGYEYLASLHQLALDRGVDFRYEAERFRPGNGPATDGELGPAHSLIDAYLAADVITYPSLYEGFGNALVEAVYFRKLVVVNRYPVYEADIRPLGFRFIELAGEVTDQSVDELRRALDDRSAWEADADHNFVLGLEHLSYDRLMRDLEALLAGAQDRPSAS